MLAAAAGFGAAPAAPSLALAASPAFAHAVLRVDVDGDGRPDDVAALGTVLLVRTAAGVEALPGAGRLDGAIRLRGVAGALLLVRVAGSRTGFVDAIVRIDADGARTLRIRGGVGGGLVTALVGRTYLTPDCGAAAGTVSQVRLEHVAGQWRRTVRTFVLRGDEFVPAGTTRRLVSDAAAARPTCAIARR